MLARNISNIAADFLTRNHKEHLVAYYKSDKCQCGRPKHTNRWLCLKCTVRMLNTGEMQALDANCKAHINAIENYLTKAKEDCE